MHTSQAYGKKNQTCKMCQRDRLNLCEAFFLHHVESDQKTKILMLLCTVVIYSMCMLL